MMQGAETTMRQLVKAKTRTIMEEFRRALSESEKQLVKPSPTLVKLGLRLAALRKKAKAIERKIEAAGFTHYNAWALAESGECKRIRRAQLESRRDDRLSRLEKLKADIAIDTIGADPATLSRILKKFRADVERA